MNLVTSGPIAFLANSFDSRIMSGDWIVVGNERPDQSRIPFPPYKAAMGTMDNIYIFSHDGKRQRKATSDEARKLDYRTSVAPIRLENALRALHGFAEWQRDYDQLTYRHLMEQAAITV
jgi:hypothetical protein